MSLNANQFLHALQNISGVEAFLAANAGKSLAVNADGNAIDFVSAGSAAETAALAAADVVLTAADKAKTTNAKVDSYTLALTDAGKAITMTKGTATDLTVPPNTIAFPIGTVLQIENLGAGAMTIVAGEGVTVNVNALLTLVLGQFGVAFLRKTATNVWIAYGGLVAA